MEVTLQKLIDFADRAHGEQMRKYTPDRYIVHPVRVMNTCRQYTNDLPVLAAAIFHDVLEDTPVTKEELSAFLESVMSKGSSKLTMKYVIELTDIYVKKNYPQWNRRKRKNKEAARLATVSPQAQTIKYADIMDNCIEIVNDDPEFAGKYLHECRDLLEKMEQGIAELRQAAIKTVNVCLEQLHNKLEGGS